MTILYIIFAILIFGILIAIHEFGHFVAAKLCGVRVEEYAIGMGPALWKKQKGETLYALRAFPVGGYCLMTGEDGENEDPRAFNNQCWWKRVIILAAGSFMNFLLGFIIVVLIFCDASAFRTPILSDFMEGCPYESADGLQVGDRIYSIDGHRIYRTEDVTDFLGRGDGVYDFVVVRDGQKHRLNDFRFEPLDYPGYENKMYGIYFGYEEATPAVKLRVSWETTMEFGRWVWMGLRELLGGGVKVADMAGPVGIVDLMAETGTSAKTVKDGISDVLYLGAFIAVNLSIMNMLPIPALDGGRLFALIITSLIQLITGKKVNPKYESYINTAGLILLLGLMAVIMCSDIIRIIKQ